MRQLCFYYRIILIIILAVIAGIILIIYHRHNEDTPNGLSVVVIGQKNNESSKQAEIFQELIEAYNTSNNTIDCINNKEKCNSLKEDLNTRYYRDLVRLYDKAEPGSRIKDDIQCALNKMTIVNKKSDTSEQQSD